MSYKDQRYCRKCVICGDILPGTDDGVEVFESLKDQVTEIDTGKADYTNPNCTLCGLACPIEEARAMLAKGEPKLNRVR